VREECRGLLLAQAPDPYFDFAESQAPVREVGGLGEAPHRLQQGADAAGHAYGVRRQDADRAAVDVEIHRVLAARQDGQCPGRGAAQPIHDGRRSDSGNHKPDRNDVA